MPNGYTHRDWAAAHSRSVETVDSIGKVFEATLPALEQVRAGRTQIEGTNAMIGRARDLVSTGVAILDKWNARFADINRAASRAGGDAADVAGYHAS